jgi:TonB family protein
VKGRSISVSVVLLLCGGCVGDRVAVAPEPPAAAPVLAPEPEGPVVRTPVAQTPLLEKTPLPDATGAAESGDGSGSAAEVAKYQAGIRQKITTHWKRPETTRRGPATTVRVKLEPGGQVTAAKLVRSSGDTAFDRSVLSAVRRASPLPVPEDPDRFERFREIEFVFKPEE